MPGYRSAAQTVLARKCRVYANGCLKRGRFQEAGYYLNIEKSFTEKS
jgi:hypothetical protein